MMNQRRAEGLLRLTLFTQKITRCLAGDAAMTVSEFHCMMQLYLAKPCCVRKLTEILGIGATSTSKILRSLDRKGWISRSLDVVDRRMERVVLTPLGESVVGQLLVRADTIATRMIEQLPADRQEPFTECIDTISRHTAYPSQPYEKGTVNEETDIA